MAVKTTQKLPILVRFHVLIETGDLGFDVSADVGDTANEGRADTQLKHPWSLEHVMRRTIILLTMGVATAVRCVDSVVVKPLLLEVGRETGFLTGLWIGADLNDAETWRIHRDTLTTTVPVRVPIIP